MPRDPIRALVVDDEAIARRSIVRQLRHDDDIEVTGECGDGLSAIGLIRDERPDLVFLDVQMPEKNGFEVIEAVGPQRMPVTIFVTAHDEHALRAFDVNAVDYLLKPFRRERLARAVERAKARLRGRGEDAGKITALLESIRTGAQYARRIAAQEKGKVVLVDVDSIDSIEADGNYARLCAGEEVHVVRETLAELERRLNPRDFLRIHRSAIVNVRRIREVHPWFGGHHVVVLESGRRLRFSRHQREKLKMLLDGF